MSVAEEPGINARFIEFLFRVIEAVGAIYVYAPVVFTNWPSPLVILTQTAPAAWAGVVAAIWVASVTLTPVAALPPMVTAREVPVKKPVPTIVTADAGDMPEFGVMLINVGGCT